MSKTKPGKQEIRLSNLSYGGLIASIVGSVLGILTVLVLLGMIPVFHALWNENADPQDPEFMTETWHIIEGMMIFWGLLYLAGSISCLTVNAKTLKRPTRQGVIASGILAILFGEGPLGLIGGILTLAGNEHKTPVPSQVIYQ